MGAQYIDSRTIKNNVPCGETGQLITKNTPAYGFLCINDNQDDNKKNEAGREKRCNNYKTRFCCKPERPSMYSQWSSWSSCNYQQKEEDAEGKMLWCNKELKFAYRKRRCLLNSRKTPCTTGPHAKEQRKNAEYAMQHGRRNACCVSGVNGALAR